MTTLNTFNVSKTFDDSPVKLSPVSIGTVAHSVMGSTFKRADRFRDALVKSFHTDRESLDPEDIHQMRVSLRQLRSCLQVFGSCIRLGKAAQEPVVKALAQSLGSVRDLDILQGKLETDYLPGLPKKEQPPLQKVLRQLQRKRSRYLDTLEYHLTSDRYQRFQKTYHTWLKSPQFASNANLSFTFLAPDIFLVGLSQWLQHPGWFVATIAEGEVYTPLSVLDIKELRSQEKTFHGLRKCIKQFRYQLVLLSPFLDETSAASIMTIVTPLKTFQDILGNLQDLAVIRDLLHTFLDHQGLPRKTLKTCLQQIDENYLSLWQQWQPIQAQYLSPAFRFQLRQQMTTVSLTCVTPANSHVTQSGGKP